MMLYGLSIHSDCVTLSGLQLSGQYQAFCLKTKLTETNCIGNPPNNVTKQYNTKLQKKNVPSFNFIGCIFCVI